MEEHNLQDNVPTPEEDKVHQEEMRLQALTKGVKAQYEDLMSRILYILVSLTEIAKLKEFCLAQSVRAQLSPEDQERIRRAGRTETVKICVESFKWYSKTFSEEVQRHFKHNDQQLQRLLSEMDKLVCTYFKEKGRVISEGSKVLIVTDAEYRTLTTSQQEELYLTALAAIEKLDASEVGHCDVATAALILKRNASQEATEEESMQDETEVLVTLRKDYRTGLDTIWSLHDRSRPFPPASLTSPLCWTLTASQLNKLFLTTVTTTEKLDTAEAGNATTAQIIAYEETEELLVHDDTGELITPSKSYRLRLKAVQSLCDRFRLFPHVFLTSPPR